MTRKSIATLIAVISLTLLSIVITVACSLIMTMNNTPTLVSDVMIVSMSLVYLLFTLMIGHGVRK